MGEIDTETTEKQYGGAVMGQKEGFKLVVPGDATVLPGMKTIMADRSELQKVTYIRDVEYVKRREETLHLQLLLPAGLFPGMYSARKYPLVVYVQGAAWGEQEMYFNLPQLCQIARKGYVVASVKHRASATAGFPAFLQDVKSAIRFLRKNAELYSINPEEVAVWGDSSGGNAALLAGVTGDMEEFKTEDNHEVSDAVKAVIDFFGPTDVTRINDMPRNPEFTKDKSNIPEDILFGGCVAEHPEIAQPGNPLNYVSVEKELPPFLIIHGDSDAMVPFNQSVLMVRRLQECRKSVEFYKVCGADHGIYFWTDEVLEIVGKFLKAYL